MKPFDIMIKGFHAIYLEERFSYGLILKVHTSLAFSNFTSACAATTSISSVSNFSSIMTISNQQNVSFMLCAHRAPEKIGAFSNTPYIQQQLIEEKSMF